MQFIKNDIFAIISNLLILDGFTDYNYKFVRDRNYISLVENDNAKSMVDGEFLWDEIEERNYGGDFIFKISTHLEVPELHINWKIDVNSFKLILNILDKMKVKIYFIVDLEYLLNNENNFEEILKELNSRLNFKVYSESIIYKFKNNIKDKTIHKELNLPNEIYTHMISNDWNILILNLVSLNSCLLNKLIKTNEEILGNVFYSEEISNDTKKIIYYKQWKFTIECDEELKIIEGLTYAIYFEDWLFETISCFESNGSKSFDCLRSIPEHLLKYNNIFYGINSRTYDGINLYDEYLFLENTCSYIDILVWWKIKEKWLLLVKYYSYLVHEYLLENSDIFGYRIQINDFSNIVILNSSKLYEKWGIDSFPDYSNEYLIKNILNHKSKDVKNIWNIIDKIRKNDSKGILLY